MGDVLRDQLSRVAASIRPYVEVLVDVGDELLRHLAELPQRIRLALETFGRHGWYFDLDLPHDVLFELADAFNAGNVQDANDALCSYIDDELGRIERVLTAAHPRRARILAQAFAAHRAGSYALSIPVFLAQSDGICLEFAREGLYKRKKKRPAVASLPLSEAEATLLHPLTMILPLIENENERPNLAPGMFNRHVVVHGESTDYDTELNGCRAVSLITYVSAAVRAQPNS